MFIMLNKLQNWYFGAFRIRVRINPLYIFPIIVLLMIVIFSNIISVIINSTIVTTIAILRAFIPVLSFYSYFKL